jgi:hypothetical protein
MYISEMVEEMQKRKFTQKTFTILELPESKE